MKTSLDHLPLEKQEELERICRMIREEFEVEMIILFGSYARGDWVEELGPDGFYYNYQSDFDILVIAERKRAKKHPRWDRLEERIIRSSVVPTPVTMIHHSVGYFHERLRQGHYFFTDIKEEGIMLYDSQQHPLPDPQPLSPEQYKEKASKYFRHWFHSACGFLKGFSFYMGEDQLNIAAFELHQAAERFYSALLLVLTDYKPKSHDLKKLGSRAAGQAPELLEIFPAGTEEERRRFELLRKSYVDARYDENFQITREDLQWLAQRVEMLKTLTEQLCQQKIASFDEG